MKLTLNATKVVAASLVLGVVLAGCSSDPPMSSSQLLQRIESARTPADQESLAEYYEGEATVARARAAGHRKMAKTYQGLPTGGQGNNNMPAYHDALATQADSSAVDFAKLAEVHRRMAATAKP